MKYLNSEMDLAIAECIHSQRDRTLLRLKLIDGWTNEATAEHPAVDRTPKQVANVLAQNKEDLFAFILDLRQRTKR